MSHKFKVGDRVMVDYPSKINKGEALRYDGQVGTIIVNEQDGKAFGSARVQFDKVKLGTKHLYTKYLDLIERKKLITYWR